VLEVGVVEIQEKKLGTHFGDGFAYTKVLYRLLIVFRVL
jgi:DNA-directed RNA polymerase subunit E'/Rpb7